MEEQLELVVVQMEECRRLMKLDTAPHLRIALLLTDNVAEVIMAQKIENVLSMNHLRSRILDLAASGESSYSEAFIEKARAQHVSPKQRRDIDRRFDSKVDLLLVQDLLPEALGSGLKWLHRYRNDAYHKAELRTRVLRPAVQVYFEMCCLLLEGYFDPLPLVTRIWFVEQFAEAFPALARHSPLKMPGAIREVPITIAHDFRKEAGADFRSLQLSLIEHLRLRIDEIDKTLTIAYESLLDGEGWTRGDVLRLAQLQDIQDEHLPASLEKARSRQYRYKLRDLDRWREEAARLAEESDRFSLFGEFSRIESDMEPCYKLVYEAALVLDRIREEESDRQRGK